VVKRAGPGKAPPVPAGRRTPGLAVTVLVAAWALVLLLYRFEDLKVMLAWTLPLLVRVPVPTISGLAGRIPYLLKIPALAAGFAVLFAFSGAGLLRFLSIPSRSGVLYRCLAYPLGFGAASMLLLGLLLCGLWFPVVMFAFLILVVLASRPLASWRGLLPRRSPVPGMSGPMLAAVTASIALFIPWMLAPETHPDGWTYHLAGPDRWLAAHGLSLRQAAAPLFYPFLGELPSAFALIFGDDSIPKFWFALWFLCGIRAFMEAVDEENRGWGMLGGLASVSAVVTFGFGKIEGVGAGAALLAFACLAREPGPLRWTRWTAAAGVAVGLLFSYKYLGFFNVLWIPVAAVIIRRARGFGWLAGAGTAAAFACIPWYARNFLVAGDPFFPQLVIRFPDWFNGFDGRAAVTAARWVPWDLEPMSPMRYLGLMAGENLFFVLVFPLAFLVGGFRSAVLALVPMGFAVALGHAFNSPQTERWFMPTIIPAVLVSSAAAGKWLKSVPGRQGRAAFAALCAVLAFSTAIRFTRQFGVESPWPYLLGTESREEVRWAERTALVDLPSCYRGLPPGGTLIVGDFSEYRMPKPVRLNYQAESGEAPFLWKVVGSSRDEGEIMKRFRQAGISYVLYNPVRAENNVGKYMAYKWSDQMVALYRSFWARHSAQAARTPTMDQRNGIFYLYRVEPRALSRADAYINHLPGTEDLMAGALHKRFRTRKYRESVAELEALCAKYPGVGHFQCQLAHSLLFVGENRRAYGLFREVIGRGLLNDTVLGTYGMVALSLDKYAESMDIFRLSMEIERDRKGELSERMVLAHILLGLDMQYRGDLDRAAAVYREGIREAGDNPPRDALRALGFLHAILGYLENSRGNLGVGRAEMARAERTLPDISRQTPAQMQAIIARIRSSIKEQVMGIVSGSIR
jgi:hypothetical protein